jgi:hypothetical protein
MHSVVIAVVCGGADVFATVFVAVNSVVGVVLVVGAFFIDAYLTLPVRVPLSVSVILAVLVLIENTTPVCPWYFPFMKTTVSPKLILSVTSVVVVVLVASAVVVDAAAVAVAG